MEILDSWKEIASYVQRDIRTCQRWENKMDFPIHRFEGQPKSRVFSYMEEIDEWMKEKLNNCKIDKLNPFSFSSKKSKVFFVSALLASIVTAFLAFTMPQRKTWASDFKIHDSKLIILDNRHKPIWEFDLGLESLELEGHYRGRFQEKRYVRASYFLPCIIIKDINNDSSREILFVIQTTDHSKDDIIYCFSEKGEKLWDYKTGKKMTFGEKEYEDFYRILGIVAEDVDSDGAYETIIISNHRSDFPSQVAVLDSKGTLIGEFWNSGHFEDIDFIDLNRDGVKEIILSGTNAEKDRPSCAIVDFKNINGASPQEKDYYRCRAYEFCCVKYILLPKNPVDTLNRRPNTIRRIDINEDKPDKLIQLRNLITYTLNSDLELIDISFTQRFLADYKKHEREGKLKIDPYETKQQMLNEDLIFYDKEKWSSTPSTGKDRIGESENRGIGDKISNKVVGSKIKETG